MKRIFRKRLAWVLTPALVALPMLVFSLALHIGARTAYADTNGCPNPNGRPTSNLVGAYFTTSGNDATYYFNSFVDRSPTNGVPGLIEYCIYPNPATQPDTVVTVAVGADNSAWSDPPGFNNFSFNRTGGNPSNIPLDGRMDYEMGTAMWSGGVPADQTIVLHINDETECNRLGQNSQTCFVLPGEQQTAQNLTVTKTATPSYTRTFNWTIDKSTNKDRVYSAGGGESEPATFTIDVTKHAGTDSDFAVNGTITVHNPNSFDVNDVDISDSIPNGNCSLDKTTLDVPADGSASTDYTCTFTSNPGSGTNTATATWPDIGSSNTSADGTADFTFGDPTTVVHDEIDVTDTNGGSWHFNHSGSVSYDQTYNDPAGTCTSHTNTATIEQTDQSASATVEDCQGADLTVTKGATPSFDRTYSWTIDKSVDKTTVKQVGGSATFNYTVKVTHDDGTDGNWQVSGTITVHNPNDWEAITADLSDAVDNGGDCSVSPASVSVPADGDKTANYTCTYASAPSPADGTNTATATWDAAAAHTPSDSADGTAPVKFSTADPTLVDECANVTDTHAGTLGTVCVGDANPTEFTYSRTIAVQPGCVSYDNTATFTTNDTEATGSDSQTVTVCGPVQTGALTIGFWKTTNGQGLIKTYCQNPALANYLKGLGGGSGPFSNAPTTSCNDLANYVSGILTSASATDMNKMLKAQMLGSALDVWFSGPGWTSTKIGGVKPPSNFLSHNNLGTFKMDTTAVCPMVDNTSAGTATCKNNTPSTDAVASGAVPSSPMSMQAILDFAATTPSPFNGSTSASVWYGGNRTKQEILKNIFDQFNNQLAFGSF